MAEPQRAVVSRFRGDPVGRADLLLHVARRPVRKTREEGGSERYSFGGVDGAQRGLFHCRETEVAGRSPVPGRMVSPGSVDDVAGGRGPPTTCVLKALRSYSVVRAGN